MADVSTMAASNKRGPKFIPAPLRQSPSRRFLNILRSIVASLATATALAGCSPTGGSAAIGSGAQQAKILFDERCKGAGERVIQKVNGVDGLFLLKVRPSDESYDDQFRLNDPYGRDLVGEGYIESFLRGSYETNTRRPKDCSRCFPIPRAYRFIEVIDPADGLRYRYTGSPETKTTIGTDGKPFTHTRFVLHRERSTGPVPRYAVTYDDISTQQDRDHWIAGSSLKVVDQQSGQVIGERIGYMYDPLQGRTSGGRSPWLWAANHACPAFAGAAEVGADARSFTLQPLQTERFAEKVLIPAD